LRIKEVWAGNATVDEDGFVGKTTFYYEPDFGAYTAFPEVESAARVLYEEAAITMPDGARSDAARLMGVFTDEFGRTVWYRDGLLPTHLYDYLNAISQTPNAMLLSSNLNDRFRLGDTVSLNAGGRTAMGVVYGFVDYWPGFTTFERIENSDGTVTEREGFLAVANLGYLQSEWGVTPYEVWLKTNAGSGNFMSEYANERSIRYSIFRDAKADIIAARNAPVLQGTNGILTVDFIITLVICAVGFLIYWILSIKGRELQFGVFRAMGLSMGGILTILLSEQVLITGFAILLGAGIGELSSELFVPIIQAAYSASEQTIPMLIVMERADYARLYTVAGSMTAACLLALGVIVKRIKIAQALKLGED
jgi:putative ABC transport system permease protein